MNVTDDHVEMWVRVLKLAGVDSEIAIEVARRFGEEMRILAEEAENIIRALGYDVVELMKELEKCGVFDYEPTARKKKRERDRRKIIKRDTASRFRQYKARESDWATRERTGPRCREWRGPWKGN